MHKLFLLIALIIPLLTFGQIRSEIGKSIGDLKIGNDVDLTLKKAGITEFRSFKQEKNSSKSCQGPYGLFNNLEFDSFYVFEKNKYGVMSILALENKIVGISFSRKHLNNNQNYLMMDDLLPTIESIDYLSNQLKSGYYYAEYEFSDLELNEYHFFDKGLSIYKDGLKIYDEVLSIYNPISIDSDNRKFFPENKIYKSVDYKTLFIEGIYSSRLSEDQYISNYYFFHKDGTGFFIATEEENGIRLYEYFNWEIHHNVMVLDYLKSQYVDKDNSIKEYKYLQFFRFSDYGKGEFIIDRMPTFYSSGEIHRSLLGDDFLILKRLGDLR